jgi:pimeloyl-ACP methyl ester carboxylesterase
MSDPDPGPGRPLAGAHDDTTTPFNLVDVAALIRHRYDGHGLRRTRLVEDAATFRRWVVGNTALQHRVVRAHGTPDTHTAFWHRPSVASYLSRIAAPVRIHHGTADPTCPESWSVATAGLLQSAGANVRLLPCAGQPHRFTRDWPLFMTRTDRFLRTTL